ncbi:hypothetical protein [Serinicoccus kebangsaanensis]|uniref:hypothetical protein n=1 Tax=Serinicoccus kebangsaanensis TaxID=2602069 RepID=UPI00124D672B|nr:hypothetical protein [Serinicoccus kebangsaanensis]
MRVDTVMSLMGSALSMNLAEVAGLLALSYGALAVARNRPGSRMRRARRRALHSLGVARPAIRARVRELLNGSSPSPAEELVWLAKAKGLKDEESITYDRKHLPPANLAEAYARLAGELERGPLLGGDLTPVVGADAARARDVAEILRRHDNQREILPGEPVELLSRDGNRRLVFLGSNPDEVAALEGKEAGRGPVLQAQDLIVSYRPERVVIDPPIRRASAVPQVDLDPIQESMTRELRAEDHGLRIPEEARDRIAKSLQRSNHFDGIVPRLISWRSEIDNRSGRRALHLSLAETTYAAVVATHHHAPDRQAPPGDSTPVGVVTLSAVPVTACGRLVFVRRSKKAGSHQGLLGPAVNGNLEMERRPGVDSDFDSVGLPDLRRALVREAREELGLRIDESEIVVMGLGRFDDKRETGTHVLLGACQLTLDRDDLLAGMRHADPIEGAWENDLEVVTLRLPSTEKDLQLAIDWLVGSSDLTSHAVMAGLGALSLGMRDETVLEKALKSRGLHEVVDPPAHLVEARHGFADPTSQD